MIDLYASYYEAHAKVYGERFCMTREQWDRACKAPRITRNLTDDEFDDNYDAIRNGDTGIY